MEFYWIERVQTLSQTSFSTGYHEFFQMLPDIHLSNNIFTCTAYSVLACVAGIQRGGRGEVESDRARSTIVWDLVGPNDRASCSHSTSPSLPHCTPAMQANSVHLYMHVYK